MKDSASGRQVSKAQEAFAFFFCLARAAVTLIFYYGTYRCLLWKICVRSTQLDITQVGVIVLIKRVYQIQVLMSFAIECRVPVALGILINFNDSRV